MNREETLSFLAQENARQQRFRSLFGEDWVIVEASIKREREDIGIGASVLPIRQVAHALSAADWDPLHYGGGPGFISHHEPGKPAVVTYHRFGDESDVEPLVVHRSFGGMRPPALELSEEFRLFHDLFHDPARNQFIRFAENGDEEIIVRVKPDRVEVQRRELMQYVTAKEMVLALYVDRWRYGVIAPALGLDERVVEDVTKDDMVYSFELSDTRDVNYKSRNVHSRLLGKLLIRSGPEWECSPDRQRRNYEEFIISVDVRGEDVFHTCDPDLLARPFGASLDAPHYLTPVFFRREVLQKYFGDSSRYEVGDSFVRCGGMWDLRLDNNHERYVIVWLGDLGRYLPAREHSYWRGFNVRPDGTISETYARRALLGVWAEPTAEDHVFKDQYRETNDGWKERFGWPLFLSLAAGDEHVFSSLRVPLSDSPAELDAQFAALTKLLVDSLNEVELARGLSALRQDAKGIVKLEAFLKHRAVEGSGEVIDFLRGIQEIRSTGIAHRKGKDYERAKRRFGVGSAPNPDVFRGVLKEAIQTLRLLDAVRLPTTSTS